MKDSQKELYKKIFGFIAALGFMLILSAANDQTFANLGF